MYERPPLNTTLGELRTVVADRVDKAEGLRVEPGKIEFHLDATDPTITLGDKEIPASSESLGSFADALQIPTAALKRMRERVSKETVGNLLTEMTHNTFHKDVAVTMFGDYVSEVEEWGRKEGVKPVHLVDAAISVLDQNAPLARLIDTPAFFGFDCYAPEGFNHGYGGDGVTENIEGSQVQDITAGGFRLGVNLKSRLAPFAEEWMFRLACTNGMTIENTGLKVEARGQSVDDVIAELEEMAQIAFGHAERNIAAFYELREQKVDNVERAIRTIGRERDLPDRSQVALIDLAASETVPDDASMFDVVNLITNFANAPAMVRRDGGRLLLEGAGGSVISDHAARCGHCRQKVS